MEQMEQMDESQILDGIDSGWWIGRINELIDSKWCRRLDETKARATKLKALRWKVDLIAC